MLKNKQFVDNFSWLHTHFETAILSFVQICLTS